MFCYWCGHEENDAKVIFSSWDVQTEDGKLCEICSGEYAVAVNEAAEFRRDELARAKERALKSRLSQK